MTTCVAAWTGKNFAMATDSQLNLGSTIVQDDTPKMFRIGNLHVAFAGSYWMYTHFKAMFFGLEDKNTSETLLKFLFGKSCYCETPSSEYIYSQCLVPLILGHGKISMKAEEIEMGLHVIWDIMVTRLNQRHLENHTQNPEDNSYGCQLAIVCRHGAYEVTSEGNVIRKNLVIIGSGTNFVQGAALALTNSVDSAEVDAKISGYSNSELKNIVGRLVEIAGSCDTDTNRRFTTVSGKI